MYLYYDLSVESHAVLEIFVFFGVFVLTFGLNETWMNDLVMKEMMVPFCVIIVQIINFLMR